MREGVEKYGRVHLRDDAWESFAAGLRYVAYDMDAIGRLRASQAGARGG